MDHCPRQIADAQVIAWATIDDTVVPTGNTTHRVGGDVVQPFKALAICQYRDDPGCYLFYCDARWEPVTDTWHETLDDAKAQAEFEYRGIASRWREAV